MADAIRQDEQIEKLWDAIHEILEDFHESHEELREIRIVAIGMDGRNGMRNEIAKNTEAIKDLRTRIDVGYMTCPLGEKMKDHFDTHAKKETGVLTARRFYIGQIITVMIFLAGMWFRK